MRPFPMHPLAARHRPALVALFAAMLPLAVGGCLLGGSRRAAYPEAPLTLAEARAAWTKAAMADYTLVYQRVCLLCSPDARGPFRVSVAGGRVASVEPVGIAARTLSPARADSVRMAYGLRVEDAFDLLDAAYARGADVVRVSYDPELGHPLVLYVDDDGRAGGDPVGLRITVFPSPGDAAPAASR